MRAGCSKNIELDVILIVDKKRGTFVGGFITPEEFPRVSHMVTEADFDTESPNPYRIERIASEIREYLNYKRKHGMLRDGDSI